METKEQLFKEHDEWAVKFEKAHERILALLPSKSALSRESLAQLESAKKDELTALARLWEINYKLCNLSQ